MFQMPKERLQVFLVVKCEGFSRMGKTRQTRTCICHSSEILVHLEANAQKQASKNK